MKKLITTSIIAISACLGANEFAPRHGIQFGISQSFDKSEQFDFDGSLTTGNSLPGIQVGYLYEQPQGACLRINSSFSHNLKSGNSSRFSGVSLIDFRYRFAFENFSLAPLIGLKTLTNELNPEGSWYHHQSSFVGGLEVANLNYEDIEFSAEAKILSSYYNYVITHRRKGMIGWKMKSRQHIELETAIRFNLNDAKSNQLEFRPFYHYFFDSMSKHKVGMQINFIKWM